MERMGVEYQRFDGKEYVSLKRYYNLLCKCKALEKENKKLREFKEKREESRFYFKAQMERAEPKTASEAEDLQKFKELFEKLYREELYYLEKENKNLKEDVAWYEKEEDRLREEIKKLKEEVRFLEECLDRKEKLNVGYRKENKKLREELSAYDREYFDEDKKAKNIFKEDDTYVYDAKQVRDIC